MVTLVGHYPLGAGCLCNLLLDLAIASFPSDCQTNEEDIQSFNQECDECKDQTDKNLEELKAISVENVATTKLMQSSDSILDDSLSSSGNLSCSNESELGFSGYAADDNLSINEFEVTSKVDRQVLSSAVGAPLLFPQLTQVVVQCLSKACQETVNWCVGLFAFQSRFKHYMISVVYLQLCYSLSCFGKVDLYCRFVCMEFESTFRGGTQTTGTMKQTDKFISLQICELSNRQSAVIMRQFDRRRCVVTLDYCHLVV